MDFASLTLDLGLWTLDELTDKSATELAALIAARAVSPIEVVEAHLRRIEALNPKFHAVVTVAPDALERARAAEDALMQGAVSGVLHGVPFTVKDTIDTAGLRTTYGSLLYAEHVPARDAVAVARLKAAGAIVLGKTNTAEMALTYEAQNPLFGRTNNPHDARRTAGGSSGGEAAAICAHLSPAGIGSDLMGSIRVPAHFCGIAGLKPTMGRVSSVGHTPPATGALSLGATVGPLARRVEDLSLLLRALSEPNALQESANASAFEESQAAKRLRRGTPCAWYAFDGISPVNEETLKAVRRAAGALADAGLLVEERRPPCVSRGQELWTRLFSHAARGYLLRAYAGQEQQAGADARFLLQATKDAAPQTLDDYLSAWDERDALRAELLRWMEDVPLIVAPVGSVEAFEHGARKVRVGDESLSIFRAFSYSQTFNVYGLPAVAVPAGRTSDNLPIGVQVIGKPFAEETVLAAAEIIEAAHDS